MGGDATLGTQNILFRDSHPGQLDERGAVMDETRSVGFLTDATLDDFFSRPVRILEQSWSVSQPLYFRFNPWELFWLDRRNREKIRNFYLLKHKLHVKFLLNGNAFYYGRAVAVYEPLAPLDDTNPTNDRPEWVDKDFVRGSQRMKVFLNPTTSEGGSLELPFFYPENALTVPLENWSQMGEIVLYGLNELRNANGATEDLTITVMAWAEDVSYAIPTREVISLPTENVAEMDEHEKNVISRPASTVARIAGSLSNVPMIGPYAKATEIGAKAVASVAKIFGYSSPTNLDYDAFVPNPRHSMAVVDTKNMANKLSVDSKQEVTLDPTTTGIRPDDELPIASIAGRESYLTTFNWQVVDDPGFLLWNMRVDPGLHARNLEEYHFPACAFAALPFKYWRGTMRVRFQIVSSSYHRGRLRIVYDPFAGGDDADFNTHYTTIHDIADEKDFSVDIGWAQSTPYRESTGWGTPDYGTTTVLPNFRIGNGVLSVHVLNALTIPGDEVADVQINVYISMLDDFEVAEPDAKASFVRFRKPIPPPPPAQNVPEMDSRDADDVEDPIADPPAIDSYADTQMDDPTTTKVFFGEVIGSFRQLMKRMYRVETAIITDNSFSNQFTASRGAFPTYGGFWDSSFGSGTMIIDIGDGRLYIPTETTMLNYVARAFLGWRGSVRWLVDTASLSISGGGDRPNSLSYALARDDEYTNTQGVVDYTGLAIGSFGTYLAQNDRTYDSKGMYLGNTNVNPIQAIEVPYYKNARFSYTFREESFTGTNPGPGWHYSVYYPSSEEAQDIALFRTYCSAGEDFNLFFFNGIPPCYYEEQYPVIITG